MRPVVGEWLKLRRERSLAADGPGEVKSATNGTPGCQGAVEGTFPQNLDELLYPRSMSAICLLSQSYMVCWWADFGQYSSNPERHPTKTGRFSKGYTGLNGQTFQFYLYCFLQLNCLGSHLSPSHQIQGTCPWQDGAGGAGPCRWQTEAIWNTAVGVENMDGCPDLVFNTSFWKSGFF